MKKFLLLSALLLATFFANAQAVQDWSQYLYGPGSLIYGPQALNNTITCDASGNIYAIGVFNSTSGASLVDLDPTAGVFNLNLLSGNIYITKTDAVGNFIWARQLGGNSPGFAGSITLDSNQNIYITGKVGYGFWDFNPSPTINNMVYNQSDQSNFIEKLTPNGDLIWVKLINNIYNESYDQIDDISVDSSGNVYATGSYRLNADFDPGMAVFNLSDVTDAYTQIFVLKLDVSGNFVWAKAFKQTASSTYAYVTGHSIKSDSSGNVYVSGYFAGTTDFDPGVAVLNKISVGQISLFITKLDVSGNLLWVNTYEKNHYSGFESKLVLDILNNPIVFDTTRDNLGGQFSTLFKLNCATGIAIWTKSIAGVTVVIGPNGLSNKGTSDSNGMILDGAGNIYLSGQFQNTVDFDPGAGVFTMSPAVNPNNMIANFDGYFVKLDGNGNFIYANKIGALGNDYVSNILVNPSGKLIIKGIAGVGGFNKATTTTSEGAFMASYTQPALATSQFELSQNVVVYPNPSTGEFNIKINNDLLGANAAIYNILGQKVNQLTLDVLTTSQNLDKGMYLIEIAKDNSKTTRKLIVK
ncbi:MAG: T9SS type A sorting domain-containing protein [Flavobacterium sp.]|nr:T9SS type A sorting domain-containing protein [Flavobacterium sp.]